MRAMTRERLRDFVLHYAEFMCKQSFVRNRFIFVYIEVIGDIASMCGCV